VKRSGGSSVITRSSYNIAIYIAIVNAVIILLLSLLFLVL